MIKIKENSVEFYIHKEDSGIIPSKSMNVFYNKSMELNRDISNLAIISYFKLFCETPLTVIDGMAATGVGSIRLMKDCQYVKNLYVNDINPLAVDLMKLNFKINDIDLNKVSFSQKDVSLFLLELKNQKEGKKNSPDIISIDPFGTPNTYLDAVFKTIKKVDGLICITATDTPVLFGVRKNACKRKYMSKSLRVEYSKEIGARILLQFISKIANINDLGIIPILTYYSSHFIRVFALTFKNKEKITASFRNYGYIFHCNNCGHRYSSSLEKISNEQLSDKCSVCSVDNQLSFAGPLWIGKIHNHQFVSQMINENLKFSYSNKERIHKSLNTILQEIDMPITYFNIHRYSKDLGLPFIPKTQDLINEIIELKHTATKTHFDPISIKTNMKIDLFKRTLRRTVIDRKT